MQANLPIPDADALARSNQLSQLILQAIDKAKGIIPFSQYMQMALYEPTLGYYSGGAKKFGLSGDFVTAPEMTPLFGHSLARQVAQVLQGLSSGANILELGAGTGKLAKDLLEALEQNKALPEYYFILEVSAHLRDEQQRFLASTLTSSVYQKIIWLNELPSHFEGVILGNEVFDAIPVQLMKKYSMGWIEQGVAVQDGKFAFADILSDNPSTLEHLNHLDLPEGYVTEICPMAEALIATLADILTKGILLFIDYGFPAREYYHPDRSGGTLVCHYRHHVHDNPFFYPGLQDITAHVNFTALAEAAYQHGLVVAGYTTQAQYLINLGILEGMVNEKSEMTTKQLSDIAQVQRLLSPSEMGELFKVIAFSKSFDDDLIGFASGDKTHTL
jgi:SAM-dependent MidA family methyltransferase